MGGTYHLLSQHEREAEVFVLCIRDVWLVGLLTGAFCLEWLSQEVHLVWLMPLLCLLVTLSSNEEHCNKVSRQSF
jgi:hypothetical protein